MKNNKTTIKYFLLVAIFGMLSFAVPAHAQLANPTNLVQNPSLETATVPGTPDHFTTGGYGTNDRVFTYMDVAEGDNHKAAKVDIVNYTDGDAKWVFESVSVNPGALYRFTDRYQATAPTTLIAAYTLTGGAMRFETLSTVPASAGFWETATEEFTIPSDAVAASVFHVISSVGTLMTDDYLLGEIVPSNENIFSQGIISIAFDDGWASQFDNALPILSAAHFPASFYIITKPMQDASHDLFISEAASMTTTTNPNSVMWGEIYVDPTSPTYRFTDTYTASVDSTITVGYTASDGTPSTLTPFALIAGTDVHALYVFTLPALSSGTPITITHASTDLISITNPTLIDYSSGYMSTSQVLSLQGLGHEIGGHTMHHCNLTLLPGDISTCSYAPDPGATAADEISGSRTALQNIGALIDTFAYPNGGFTSEIKSYMQANGWISARTVMPGFNTRYSDKFALKTQVVDFHQPIDRVKGWIDTAATNKLWLILTFHQVDDPVTIGSNGEDGAVTPEYFQEVISYIESKVSAPTDAIVVKTVHSTIPLMVTPVVPDTTAPIITLTGSATISLTVGDTFTDPGATGADNVDGDITANIIATGTVDTATPGTYTRHYNVSDAAGNAATEVTRTITVSAVVVPNQAPTITLTGSATMNLTVGDTFTDPGATATDPEDGVITSQITTVGTVDTAVAGTYTITYSVSDSASLAATPIVRTVIVSPATSGGSSGGGSGSGSSSGSGSGGSTGGSGSSSTGGSGSSSTGGSTTGGGGSGSGGSTTTVPPVITPPVVTPQVLGASIVCTDLLSKDMKFHGVKNDKEEVKKLQIFLAKELGIRIPSTGFYGTMTRDAVNKFQLKYKAEILTPLKLKKATGHALISTRKMINSLSCVVSE